MLTCLVQVCLRICVVWSIQTNVTGENFGLVVEIKMKFVMFLQILRKDYRACLFHWEKVQNKNIYLLRKQ